MQSDIMNVAQTAMQKLVCNNPNLAPKDLQNMINTFTQYGANSAYGRIKPPRRWLTVLNYLDSSI